MRVLVFSVVVSVMFISGCNSNNARAFVAGMAERDQSYSSSTEARELRQLRRELEEVRRYQRRQRYHDIANGRWP